jgi:hypothetical protein
MRPRRLAARGSASLRLLGPHSNSSSITSSPGGVPGGWVVRQRSSPISYANLRGLGAAGRRRGGVE